MPNSGVNCYSLYPETQSCAGNRPANNEYKITGEFISG